MFSNYCCCCFKTNEILLSTKTISSHGDNKILLDYFNSVCGVFLQDHYALDYICIRCSKGLQVAYHFINMVKERRNAEITVHKLQHKIQLKQNIPSTYYKNKNAINKLNIESQLKYVGTFIHDGSNADVGSLTNARKYDTDLMCNICNKFFENKTTFFEHNRQMHKEIVPYKCKLCAFYTCYTESLFKHCEKTHGLNNVALDLYQTKQISKLVQDNPKFGMTYLCIACNLKYCSRATIDEHLLQVHSIDEDKDSFIKEYFECPLCYRSFLALKSAKIHYSMCHKCSITNPNTRSKTMFDCEKCGKLFDLKSGLFLHRRVCDEPKAVDCNFCKFKFTSVLKYERHLQDNHSVAIKHECEICNKTFSCSEYLTVHRRRHNERYYQCDLCSKNYISNADLKVHKQRIHGAKNAPSTCAVCGKKFAHLALLKYHENKEHNKRLFKCSYCDFVSRSSSAIKFHQYNHTGKPYKCQLCPKEYAFRKSLRQHLEKLHSITLTNQEMGEFFKQTYGYSSRFDAFSEQNNNLEITEINDLKLESELQEFGLSLEDIMDDLFNGEIPNKKLS